MFPIISEAVRGIKISVAAPFFNQVNVPLGLALLLLSGVCPLIRVAQGQHPQLPAQLPQSAGRVRSSAWPFFTAAAYGTRSP